MDSQKPASGSLQIPEPIGYFFRDSLKKFALPGSGFSIGSTPPTDADDLVPLFTEAQLREAVQYAANAGYAKGYDFFEVELKQLQEQNTAIDAKLASNEAVMRQALAMLRHESIFSNNGHVIYALEDALK